MRSRCSATGMPIMNASDGSAPGPQPIITRPRVRWTDRTAPIPGTAPRAPNTVTRSPSSCWSNSGVGGAPTRRSVR